MMTRVIVALIGFAIVIPILVWGGEPGLRALACVVVAVCCDEYAKMAFPERRVLAALCLMGVQAVIASTLWLAGTGAVPIALACTWVVLFASVVVAGSGELPKRFEALTRLAFGILWIGLLWSLVGLRSLDSGLEWLFMALVVAWASDSGAYLVGRRFGRHPLAPAISPKKTREGFFGGVVAAVLAVVWLTSSVLPDVPALVAAALGLVLSVAGVVGDLAESLVKRTFGVKDSGWIMPGHGGMLDRIDSVMFVAPLAYGAGCLLGY